MYPWHKKIWCVNCRVYVRQTFTITKTNINFSFAVMSECNTQRGQRCGGGQIYGLSNPFVLERQAVNCVTLMHITKSWIRAPYSRMLHYCWWGRETELLPYATWEEEGQCNQSKFNRNSRNSDTSMLSYIMPAATFKDFRELCCVLGWAEEGTRWRTYLRIEIKTPSSPRKAADKPLQWLKGDSHLRKFFVPFFANVTQLTLKVISLWLFLNIEEVTKNHSTSSFSFPGM